MSLDNKKICERNLKCLSLLRTLRVLSAKGGPYTPLCITLSSLNDPETAMQIRDALIQPGTYKHDTNMDYISFHRWEYQQFALCELAKLSGLLARLSQTLQIGILSFMKQSN